jgi:hypothetical protein
MRKLTFIVFLIAFVAFSATAQTSKDNTDCRVERELRKCCYEKTKPYTDFQRCIEMGGGQYCLKYRKFPLLYPCLDKKGYEKPGKLGLIHNNVFQLKSDTFRSTLAARSIIKRSA